MTESVSQSENDVEPRYGPMPAVLFGSSLVIGVLLIGGTLALSGPSQVVRDDVVGGILLVTISGYGLTRVRHDEPLHPVLTLFGVCVSLLIVLLALLGDPSLPLSQLGLVVGVVGAFTFGLLSRLNAQRT